jgi:UDP-N-acetylmuramoylalanine--D-glutamate ligase
MNYSPKKVSILGAARSGCAAAKFLYAKGISVFISDSCKEEALQTTLVANGCAAFPHESGGHSDAVLAADVIVLSPGVPSNLPILKKAKERGIPVWSEIELAFRHSAATYLAVTGSTGKSTTVSMLGAIFQAARIPHVVAGNIGVPLVGSATELGPESFVVAEISSFQLENIDCFRPKVSVVLNLLKNHLDRYDNETAYYDAKKAIAVNAAMKDFVVLNAGDARLVEWAKTLESKTNVLWFGSGPIPSNGVWYENGALFSRVDGKTDCLLDVNEMKLRGVHNYENAAAAATAALLAGTSREAVAQGLLAFPGLEHRLEFVAEINTVRYYNDSKSTTAESVACAVAAFEHNVHLIAGGRDKGCDFSVVDAAIARHVKTIVLIGEAANRMETQWKGKAPIVRAKTLEEAVESAFARAVGGDVVVFSPGCSSFDMFKNFEHRGEVFKQLVRQLTKERELRDE